MQSQYHLILYKYSHHQVNCDVFRAACEYSFVSLLNNVNYLNSISCEFTLTVPSIHSPCIVKALQFLLKAHETITHKVSFLECSSRFLYRLPSCHTTNNGFVSPSQTQSEYFSRLFLRQRKMTTSLVSFFLFTSLWSHLVYALREAKNSSGFKRENR